VRAAGAIHGGRLALAQPRCGRQARVEHRRGVGAPGRGLQRRRGEPRREPGQAIPLRGTRRRSRREGRLPGRVRRRQTRHYHLGCGGLGRAGPSRPTGRVSRSTPLQRRRDHARLVRPRRLWRRAQAAPARRPRAAIRPERPCGSKPDHGLHRRGAVLLLGRRPEAAARVHGVRRAGPGREQQPGHRTDAGAVVMGGRPDSRTVGLWLVAVMGLLSARPPVRQSDQIILATTTSTRDAGLLDSLLPVFERQTRYTVKVIAVGSGQALAMGRRGDADVVLSHAPDADRWYTESGHGMGETLQMTDQKRAYTITDRATYLAWRDKLQLVPVVEGDGRLYNVYHVLELNPKNAPRINVRGGRAFADFLVS